MITIRDLARMKRPTLLVKAHKLHSRMTFGGLPISIENPKGSKRYWRDEHSGESGSTTMQHSYGYIRGSKGADGDHVDVYIGPHEHALFAYVIDQMKKPDFKEFDEQKVMLGFKSAEAAKAAYLAQYNDPRFFGSMKTIPFATFASKVLATHEHAPLVKGAKGAAATSHKYKSRRMNARGEWEYEYDDEHKGPKHDPKQKWKVATDFAESDFAHGAFDHDPTHWHWKTAADGEIRAWKAGGVDPHSHRPVKTGGDFAKLYQIEKPDMDGHPGFALLVDLKTGAKTVMSHSRIMPVEHDPLRHKKVISKEKQPTWDPTEGKKPRPVSGVSGEAAPKFEGSRANKETQPGLYAIENGEYPMKTLTRTSREGDRERKEKSAVIAVPDHGKNQLIHEFTPLITSTANKIQRAYGVKDSYEQGAPGKRSTNVTKLELQRAGIEGMLMAIETYDAEHPFAYHAKMYVENSVRLAAARERIGGVTLPERHMRNLSRFIAARAEASKALGNDSPSVEEVLPYLRLQKRHVHGNLSPAEGNKPLPMGSYTLSTIEGKGDDAKLATDTLTHPGKRELAELYHSFLMGQSGTADIFDLEDEYAFPALAIGAGLDTSERVLVRRATQNVLSKMESFGYTAEGRKKVEYRADVGEMIAMKLGLSGGDEKTTAEIAREVPVYANGKKLGERQSHAVVEELITRGLAHVKDQLRDATDEESERGLGRSTRAALIFGRAADRLTPVERATPGPTWTEIVQRRADAVTPAQIAEYREGERRRLTGIAEKIRDRAKSDHDAASRARSVKLAEETEQAARRTDRMAEAEVRMKIATRLAPETAEMRRLATQSVAVEMEHRGFERSSKLMTMTDLGTGAERTVRVRTLRDIRDPEEIPTGETQGGRMRKAGQAGLADARRGITTGMLREALHYPRTMRLLTAPDGVLAGAPTLARRSVELLAFGD